MCGFENVTKVLLRRKKKVELSSAGIESRTFGLAVLCTNARAVYEWF